MESITYFHEITLHVIEYGKGPKAVCFCFFALILLLMQLFIKLLTVLSTPLGKTFFAWRFILHENILF